MSSEGIGVNLSFGGKDEFRAALDELVTAADLAARRIVTDGGLILEAAIKDRAAVKTGTNRRSVRVDTVTTLGLGTWRSVTAPTTKYGRRLELGFHGTDSLGRHYDQDGKPYVKPAITASLDALDALAEARWAEAMER